MDILTLAIAKSKSGSPNGTITTENITNALGYKPANQEDLRKLSEDIANKPQPDWNQNDETAHDYVKNRPFYEVLGYEICNKEQTFTCELSNDGKATADLQKDVDIDYLRVNIPTVVTLDGVEYTNLNIYESGGDMCIYIKFTNENGDYIFIINNDSIYMPPSYVGTTHTIEIKQETKTVKTIDKKYLPNLIGKSGIGECSEIFNNYSNNYADGNYSHAEGYHTMARGNYSHAEGYGTMARGSYQHVQGKYNIDDTESKYVHIVGNGTSSIKRSNAHTLDWKGNAWYQGTVEGTAMIIKSSTEGSSKRFKITVGDDGLLTATEITE